MEIIPVIDVRFGQAVRAVAGQRAEYATLETPLAPGSSDPVEIARGYRRFFPFKTLYVADLDGIEGCGANGDLVQGIAEAWGGGVWLDAGGASAEPGTGAIRRVAGSESLLDRWLCGGLGGSDGVPGPVLSLDFRGDTFVGPQDLLTSPEQWPRDVIVMTLARVGVSDGPDLARVRQIAGAAGDRRRVFAAGGVRDLGDVSALRDAGAAGVLVATALHNGQIKTGDLEEIAGW